TLRSATRSAPTTAVPTAEARFWVLPRIDPTSPASSAGADVTRTLNTSVTRAPWPMPNAIRPTIVGTVSQLLVTTTDSQTRAAVASVKAATPIVRGLNRL